MADAELPRMNRCLIAYERRYPRSNRSYEFRSQLQSHNRKRRRRRIVRGVAAGLLAVAALAGYDFFAYHRTRWIERAGESDRTGRCAAMVRATRLAPVACCVLAFLGSGGTVEESRVDGQGG